KSAHLYAAFPGSAIRRGAKADGIDTLDRPPRHDVRRLKLPGQRRSTSSHLLLSPNVTLFFRSE
ncbi:MAG: hypothetical protein RQ897_14360, partial [Thermoflexus sp.]